MLIVLVAGMASGKNKIAETLNIYGVKSLVSTTSRAKRKGEEEGVEYYFKTKEELIDMICNDKVVEYRIYDTQYGKVCIFFCRLVRIQKVNQNYASQIMCYSAALMISNVGLSHVLYFPLTGGAILSHASFFCSSSFVTQSASSFLCFQYSIRKYNSIYIQKGAVKMM